VALDANGATAVSDVSHPDGSYLLTGLFPGNYQLYAEPLDGVTLEQDLSQSDHMNAFTLFNTTFLGGNATPSTVVVTAGATNSGNVVNLGSLYGVETEANNTFGAANPVTLGALMSGVANPATDVDYFSFTTATTGDFINIDVDSSGDACPLDPIITLYSTNGTTVLSSNDDFDQKGNDSRIAFHLGVSGTYFVKVADFEVNPICPNDGPGSFYTLHVDKAVPETEANNTRATANGAALGQYRGGIVSSGADTDYYSLTATFGDRLIADISANRAGSPLNPALTLFDAGGGILASCTDISVSDLDCVIDFTFTNQTPATFYIQVTAQSGAGASSYYVLHLGTDSLNVLFSAINLLGQGLGGSWAADIFPKFVQQGTSFDLIAAGTGFPLDVTLSVPGPGVTLTPSAGADFGTNANGFDFFAMSASVAGSAPPGPRPLFGQNATLKAALSGGLVITPAGVPPEIASSSGPLSWSGGQMVWAGDPSAGSYNVYRGNLSGLVDLDHNGTADNFGSAIACRITSPLVADPGAPVVGNGFFYLVAGVNANGEGTLGFTRTNAGPGPERPKSALTGPCP